MDSSGQHSDGRSQSIKCWPWPMESCTMFTGYIHHHWTSFLTIAISCWWSITSTHLHWQRQHRATLPSDGKILAELRTRKISAGLHKRFPGQSGWLNDSSAAASTPPAAMRQREKIDSSNFKQILQPDESRRGGGTTRRAEIRRHVRPGPNLRYERTRQINFTWIQFALPNWNSI